MNMGGKVVVCGQGGKRSMRRCCLRRLLGKQKGQCCCLVCLGCRIFYRLYLANMGLVGQKARYVVNFVQPYDIEEGVSFRVWERSVVVWLDGVKCESMLSLARM